MKKILFLLAVVLPVLPVLADELRPVSQDQAIQQYEGFLKTENPDPANHVVWKLYVFRAVPQHTMPNGSMQYFITGLTSYSKKSYYVGIRINQLYNYLTSMPKRGDVIVVSGRILQRRHGPVILPSGTRELDFLTLDMDGASILPDEHFDPLATPVPSPGTSSPTPGAPTGVSSK